MVSDTKQHNTPESTTAAETLWSSVLLQLEHEFPRATFDTWIRDLVPISLKNGVLAVGAGNSYAIDYVQEKLSSTIRRVLNTVSGAEIAISFVLGDGHDGYSDPDDIEHSDDEFSHDTITDPDLSSSAHDLEAIDEIVELTPEYLSLYDEIVRPDRVIVFPSYYLRWIPYLGVDLAWLPIGFRQVAFLRGLKFNPNDTFQASGREIARWSGMSLRTFRRRVNDPMLQWFIKPNPSDLNDTWTIGDDDRPHREPSQWKVVMSMPLTPDDRDALHAWLSHHFHKVSSPSRLLDLTIQTPLEELFPTPDRIIPPEIADNPTSVQSIVADFIKQHYPETDPSIDELANALAHHIIGHPIVITHYFVRKWLPVVGAGPGWLITLMRNLVSNQLGPIYEIEIEGGYDELAALLGVSAKRVSRWILGQRKQTESINLFIEEMGSFKQPDQNVSRRYRINLHDPLTPKDQLEQGEGRIDTYSGRGQGRSGTHKDKGGGRIGTHKNEGEERIDTLRDGGQGRFDTYADGGAGRSDTEEQGGQERIDTGYISGGGLKDSIKEKEDTLTSSSSKSGAKKSNREGGWNLRQLLVNAKVDPSAARNLGAADPSAFVSWLLYSASTRGVKINEPVGLTVSRLRENPSEGAGGAFDRLANLGPMKLSELVVRQLRFNDAGWGCVDWRDVMTDADTSRLQLISEIIGISNFGD